jgi:predicted permease
VRIRLKRDLLLELIGRSNRSQNHWAIQLGLSRGHWSDIVNGKHPYPSGRTREKMLEAFGVGFHELFEVEVEVGASTLPDHTFQRAIADQYLIDREVGQGGMGTVYLARDVKLGRSVAIKVVSPEAVSGIGPDEFLKEVAHTTRLQHPHILPIYDAGQAAGTPFYVMPYVREGSLRDLLQRRGAPLSANEALGIANGVAAALTHAHDHEVLHCDVKPANVLLSGRHAYLCDFGISRVIYTEAFGLARRPKIDSSAGTPAYVSPEQASGERTLDARSDIYSFGCMVFEMLSGRPPFRGNTTLAVVSQRFTTDVPNLKALAPHVPPTVADAVTRAMAFDMSRRTPSATAFVDDLERGAAYTKPGLRAGAALARARVGSWSRQRLATLIPKLRPPALHRHSKVGPMLDSLMQDFAYAWRTLRRAPGFATLVILTLGFGIAANTTVFSLLNPYFLRPLPFGGSERLVQVGQVDPVTGWDGARFSLPQFLDWRERSRAFEDMATYTYSARNATGPEGPERILVSTLSGNMFSVLDADAALGRAFRDGEAGPAAPRVAVLSHGLWNTRYGADPQILGRTIMIDGTAHSVIGVMPRDFVFPFGGVDLWVPFAQDPRAEARDRDIHLMVGRLRRDWTIERTRQELTGIQRDLGTTYPDVEGRYAGVSVTPIREALNFAWGPLRITFALMLAAVGFALLLACVNVASLSLARATARSSEVAVRAALGAGRRRIVRQLLTESALLAAVGGVIGIGVAYWAAQTIGHAIPEDLYRVGEFTIDGRVLVFTLLVTAITPVLFGLAPALTATRTDLSSVLKEGGGRGLLGLRQMRTRRVLVVFEIAMAVVLVGGTGLMIRSFRAARNLDLGFDPDRTLTAVVTPPAGEYPAERLEDYYQRAEEVLASLPGVRGAGTVTWIPLNHETSLLQFARPGQEPGSPGEWPVAIQNLASGDYFATVGIPLVAGRTFDATDRRDAPPAVIVSRALAERYWSGDSPVGRSLLIGEPESPTSATVVGVVGDVRHEGLADVLRPQIYRPLTQRPSRRRFFVLATAGDPASLTAPVRQALHGVDPNLPASVRPLREIVDENMLPWSIPSVLLGVLGIGALLLAALGIYGVIGYSVAQRRQETGVRMALGASRERIRRAFVQDGLRLTLVGLGAGLVLAVGAGQLIRSVLLGVTPFDPVTLTAVLVVFAVVAILASVLPAERASRVDPQRVLRHE